MRGSAPDAEEIGVDPDVHRQAVGRGHFVFHVEVDFVRGVAVAAFRGEGVERRAHPEGVEHARSLWAKAVQRIVVSEADMVAGGGTEVESGPIAHIADGRPVAVLQMVGVAFAAVVVVVSRLFL